MPSIKLQQVSLKHVSRRHCRARYDFVESAIECGEAYMLAQGGYVLIGGKSSLLPGFVVESYLPKNIPSGDYSELISTLCQISCAMMWLDSRDFDAFDIVLRQQLNAKPTAVLFEDRGYDPSIRRTGRIEVKTPTSGDIDAAKKLFCEMPLSLGGLSDSGLDRFLNSGHIVGGYRNGELTAAALVSEAIDERVSVGAIALPSDMRGSGLGVWFMRALLDYFRLREQVVIGSVGSSNIFAYKALVRMGMVPISQGWTVRLVKPREVVD